MWNLSSIVTKHDDPKKVKESFLKLLKFNTFHSEVLLLTRIRGNVYYLTCDFITSACAFDFATLSFNHATPAFSFLTCAFELVTRQFQVVTHGIELVSRWFEHVKFKWRINLKLNP